jgi:hypothetical protein
MTSPLHPPSTLLIGPAGTGKTSSLVTLLRAGIKVRMLATEGSAPNRVLTRCAELNIPNDGFDWKIVSPGIPSWGALIESAKVVNTMSLKDIADMKGGIAKSDGTQWITMLNAIANFTSDRTGVSYGDATEWNDDTAFVFDGLTGINTMSRNLTVGLKPNPAPGEWGVMQGNILTLLNKLASDCKCFFICIAHVERENNEISGVSNITVSTLGSKLAPKLPPLFTSTIFTKRIADKFFWSTMENGVDTKNGDLPLSDSLQPDFSLIVETYRKGVKAASAPATAQAVQPQVA